MIDVSQAYFDLDIRPLSERELVDFARRVFREFDRAASRRIPFPDYELRLTVEEGSVKGRSRVLVGAGALYLAIGQFGDFVSGAEEIARIGRAVADRVVEAAVTESGESGNSLTRTWRSAGAAGELHRLFRDVRDKRITPSEATDSALGLLDHEPLPHGAEQQLCEAFESVNLHPEQYPLPFGSDYLEPEVVSVPAPEPAPSRRKQSPSPAMPGLRVEIVKEGKRGRPRVRTSF